MGIEFEVVKMISYEDGCFEAIDPRGELVLCYLNNKERDWNKVCNSLNKTITVRGSIMVAGSFMVLEILE